MLAGRMPNAREAIQLQNLPQRWLEPCRVDSKGEPCPRHNNRPIDNFSAMSWSCCAASASLAAAPRGACRFFDAPGFLACQLAQVETRAAICEQWLPLWRALLRYQSVSEELAIRIKRIRAAMVSRLELVYRPELSTLSEAERTQLLVALDILTDFESWGRMREDHGLSIEAARDLWITAIGRMLPAAAGNPAH